MVSDFLTALAAPASLGLAAFLSATLLPGGSELVFAGLIGAGQGQPLVLFVVATLANTAGGMTSWWIGRQIARGADTERGQAWMRRFRLSEAMVRRMERLFSRYGWAALLLCWAPVIGDPITLFAGMARYPALPTALITLVARAGRYAAVWAATAGLLTWWT